MEQAIIETRELAKRYGHFDALLPMDLKVGKGKIFGLIGRNGAGKTTLLKLLTGQTEPTGGTMALFSEDTPKGLSQARKRMGVIVETPAFYGNLTAQQNMEYYRIQKGIPDTSRIPYVLAQAGIEDTGKKKYKDFSLGMKQRLGIALALLSDPDLLVLDEPLNGLDPMGIMEVRSLLQRLNRDKEMTILISSHILSELSAVATDYAFIEKGQMVEQISAQALHEKCRRFIELKTSQPQKAATVLEQKLGCSQYEVLADGSIHVYDFLDQPEAVAAAMVEGQAGLMGMESKGVDLESYFMKLVGGEQNA